MRRTSSVPIYARIEADVRRQIADGSLHLGSRLPAEQELADHYGVARMTVRQALGRLVSAGIVERRHGVGTFVSRTKTERVASHLLGFREDAIAHGLVPSTTVLSKTMAAVTSEEARLLDVDDDITALRVTRLRFASGEPIGHNTVVIVPPYAEELEGIDWTSSFYEGAAEKIGHDITEAEQTIEAQEAVGDIAKALGIDSGAALLKVTRVTYLANGRRIGLTRSLYRGDRYFLSLRLHRGGLMPP